jgi:hypothetical protein
MAIGFLLVKIHTNLILIQNEPIWFRTIRLFKATPIHPELPCYFLRGVHVQSGGFMIRCHISVTCDGGNVIAKLSIRTAIKGRYGTISGNSPGFTLISSIFENRAVPLPVRFQGAGYLITPFIVSIAASVISHPLSLFQILRYPLAQSKTLKLALANILTLCAHHNNGADHLQQNLSLTNLRAFRNPVSKICMKSIFWLTLYGPDE